MTEETFIYSNFMNPLKWMAQKRIGIGPKVDTEIEIRSSVRRWCQANEIEMEWDGDPSPKSSS